MKQKCTASLDNLASPGLRKEISKGHKHRWLQGIYRI
jgi:hypothetical protein